MTTKHSEKKAHKFNNKKSCKKVRIDLRKNKVRQFYCPTLSAPDKQEEKIKQTTTDVSGGHKNSNPTPKLLFDKIPDISIDSLMSQF